MDSFAGTQRRHHHVPFQCVWNQDAVDLRLRRDAAGVHPQTLSVYLHVCQRRAQEDRRGGLRGGREPWLLRHSQGVYGCDAAGDADGHRIRAAGVHELYGGFWHARINR